MLPHATHERTTRESAHKPKGRSMEIQRLIGRSLRSACDLKQLSGYHILLDCDVLQADGSTRTNAINGGFLALALTIQSMLQKGLLARTPLIHKVCAISCAIHEDGALYFDPTYEQDSAACADINLIFTHTGQIIEIQGTGEKGPIALPSFDNFIKKAFEHTETIRKEQNRILS